MTRPALDHRSAELGSAEAARLTGIVLSRIASHAAGETEIARDLQPIVMHLLPSDAWKVQHLRLISALAASGHVERKGPVWQVTAEGRAAAAEFLGARNDHLPSSWTAMRDGPLLVKALGLEGAAGSRLKSLNKLDGLRALIVETTWGLSGRGKPSASRIRSQLALVALERAFGNQLKSELGAKSALPAKAGRLLAGQLSKRPRDFGTDGRLVAQLAAEAVGVTRSDPVQLRLGALRRFVAGTVSPAGSAAPRVRKTKTANSALPQAPLPAGTPSSAPSVEIARPDPRGFADAVRAAARSRAEGWSGNRKAFVSQVWAVIQDCHPEWGLSEIEFKCMLTEAHRTGLLALSNADLKDKRNLAEIQLSAVTYKNTVWHYVRVDD